MQSGAAWSGRLGPRVNLFGFVLLGKVFFYTPMSEEPQPLRLKPRPPPAEGPPSAPGPPTPPPPQSPPPPAPDQGDGTQPAAPEAAAEPCRDERRRRPPPPRRERPCPLPRSCRAPSRSRPRPRPPTREPDEAPKFKLRPKGRRPRPPPRSPGCSAAAAGACRRAPRVRAAASFAERPHARPEAFADRPPRLPASHADVASGPPPSPASAPSSSLPPMSILAAPPPPPPGSRGTAASRRPVPRLSLSTPTDEGAGPRGARPAKGCGVRAPEDRRQAGGEAGKDGGGPAKAPALGPDREGGHRRRRHRLRGRRLLLPTGYSSPPRPRS